MNSQKALPLFGLALFFGIFFVISIPSACATLGEKPSIFHSDESPGKSSVTISSDDTIDNPVKLSGYLGNYYVGYSHKSKDGVWQFHIDGYGSAEGIYNTVKNGEILRIYHSQGLEQGAFDVSVKTTIKEDNNEKTAEIHAAEKSIETVNEKEIKAVKKNNDQIENKESKDNGSTKGIKETKTSKVGKDHDELNETNESDKSSGIVLNKDSRLQGNSSTQSKKQESQKESPENHVQKEEKNRGKPLFYIISVVCIAFLGLIAVYFYKKIKKRDK
ncbi:hypothetical protein ABEP12_02090 [Bacillus velezensis]